jgi:integrase
MSRNPAEGVRLPRVVRAEPVFLDHDQVAALAAACAGHGLLVRFLAYTGLRWGKRRRSGYRGLTCSVAGLRWRSPSLRSVGA